MAIDVVEVSSTDPEIGHAALNEVYGTERPVTFSGDPTGFSCRMRFVTAGPLGVDRVRHTMSVRASSAPVGFFVGWCVEGGAIQEFEAGAASHRFRRGAVGQTPDDVELQAVWDDIDVSVLRLDLATIDRFAREATGTESRVRFDGVLPVSTAAGRRWRSLIRYVSREAEAADSLLASTIVQAEMARLVAGAALTTFRNSAFGAPPQRGVTPPVPAAVCRAISFIEANAHLPITSADIAEAARVTPRALQYGFRRHFDSSPIAYLRRVRLASVHRELRDADPASGATAAQIARSWGFVHLGHFAAYYRQAYGQSPRDTLHDR